jgi:nicotinamidase/pyrazinamidase
MSKALIIVDVQNDFLPGGALGVTEGDQVIDLIVELAQSGDYGAVCTTQDWHPNETEHFREWPRHCIEGSNGARLHPLIDDLGVEDFRKGQSKLDDGYSAFEGRGVFGGWSLDKWLVHNGVQAVDVVGLALDYCVQATALDAVELGYRTNVIMAATRPVGYLTAGAAITTMIAHGVNLK